MQLVVVPRQLGSTGFLLSYPCSRGVIVRFGKLHEHVMPVWPFKGQAQFHQLRMDIGNIDQLQLPSFSDPNPRSFVGNHE